MTTVGFTSNNASLAEGDSEVKKFNFVVQLSAVSASAITVNYSTEKQNFGSATANVDYISSLGQITFAPGEISKSISIDVIGDTQYEADELFYVDLISAVGATIVINGAEGLRNSWVAGRILNDDAPTGISAGFTSNNASIAEGDIGVKKFNFVVQLSAASASAITVNYSTEKQNFGSATANVDYISSLGQITFAPGEISKSISIDVIGDTQYEADELFYVDLISAVGATIVTNGAEGLRNSWVAGRILNDDAPTGISAGFTSNNASIAEGDRGVKKFNFVVQLSAASASAITVNYSTEKQNLGSATANVDYISSLGQIWFAPGEISKSISIDVIGDTQYEADELFYVDLISAVGATIVTNGAEGLRNSWVAGRILNDDTAADSPSRGLFGTTGNDVFYSSMSTASIDGGAGQDTFQYKGPRNNFSIVKSNNGFIVTDKFGQEGSSTLINIEILGFGNAVVDLTMGTRVKSTSNANLKSLEELYVAYFNRVPDSQGLGYWIDALKGGASLEKIGTSFYEAATLPAFAQLTGYSTTMSNVDFVKIIYKNVLGRTSVDKEGLVYWSDALETEKESRGSLINTILASAHTFKGDPTYGAVADLLDNKLIVANRIAVEEGLTYLGGTGETYSKYVQIAAAVTATDTSAAILLIGSADPSFHL